MNASFVLRQAQSVGEQIVVGDKPVAVEDPQGIVVFIDDEPSTTDLISSRYYNVSFQYRWQASGFAADTVGSVIIQVKVISRPPVLQAPEIVRLDDGLVKIRLNSTNYGTRSDQRYRISQAPKFGTLYQVPRNASSAFPNLPCAKFNRVGLQLHDDSSCRLIPADWKAVVPPLTALLGLQMKPDGSKSDVLGAYSESSPVVLQYADHIPPYSEQWGPAYSSQLNLCPDCCNEQKSCNPDDCSALGWPDFSNCVTKDGYSGLALGAIPHGWLEISPNLIPGWKPLCRSCGSEFIVVGFQEPVRNSSPSSYLIIAAQMSVPFYTFIIASSLPLVYLSIYQNMYA